MCKQFAQLIDGTTSFTFYVSFFTKNISIKSFTPCLLDLCKALWGVMKSYYQTLQWHEAHDHQVPQQPGRQTQVYCHSGPVYCWFGLSSIAPKFFSFALFGLHVSVTMTLCCCQFLYKCVFSVFFFRFELCMLASFIATLQEAGFVLDVAIEGGHFSFFLLAVALFVVSIYMLVYAKTY